MPKRSRKFPLKTSEPAGKCSNPPQPSTSFSTQLEARTNYKLRVISYNWAYIEYSRRRNCHSFFFISTSKLTVIMRTLNLPRFYCGRRRFHAFELLLTCDLNWFPISPSAFLFCHICGRANSTWTYYNVSPVRRCNHHLQ